MKKAIITLIILIVVVVLAIKPLRIQYHLHKYRKASANITFDSSKIDPEQFSDSALESSRHVLQLMTLGYLAEYAIPIESPRDDADATVALLLSSFMVHKTPAGAQIETEEGKTQLTIVDRPENKHWWETVVRMNLEVK